MLPVTNIISLGIKFLHFLKDLDKVGLYLPQTRKSKEGEVGTFPEEGWAEVRCIVTKQKEYSASSPEDLLYTDFF